MFFFPMAPLGLRVHEPPTTQQSTPTPPSHLQGWWASHRARSRSPVHPKYHSRGKTSLSVLSRQQLNPHAHTVMIDTVRIKTNRLFHPDITDCLSENWQATDFQSRGVNGDGSGWTGKNRITLEDKTTGLRIGGTRFAAEWIEASLPTLLHGHNGMLITSQQELDDALNLLYEIVDQVSELAADAAGDSFTRVDLVWQFKDNLEAFKAAHRNCRHRRIRKEAVEYDGQGMVWKGTQLSVTMYDKRLKMFKKPGDVVRVEVRLWGKVLRKEFTGSEHGDLRKLSFWRCYEVYREIMCGFCPARIPRLSSMAEFLAMAAQAGWKWEGVPMFDIWRVEKSPRHLSRVRKEMARLRPKIHSFEWETLLPEDELPPLVELK